MRGTVFQHKGSYLHAGPAITDVTPPVCGWKCRNTGHQFSKNPDERDAFVLKVKVCECREKLLQVATRKGERYLTFQFKNCSFSTTSIYQTNSFSSFRYECGAHFLLQYQILFENEDFFDWE